MNPALFGRDAEPRIVAVEPAKSGGMLVYSRQPDGTTAATPHEFEPFLWSAEGTVADEPLTGDLPLRYLRRFPSWEAFQDARAATRTSGIPTFALSDPVQQFLTLTGKTLFKEMTFEDLRRLQIAITTDGPALTTIALGDLTGWQVELPAADDPAAALRRLTELILEHDPDILEGHNLFKNILPVLAAHAKRTKVKLPWGRDGSPLKSRASRLQIAEKTIQYPRFAAHGRHLVDTFVLAQYYDIGTRELENFDLETVASHLGITPDPTNPKSKIPNLKSVASVAATLSASYFIQAQIFPYNYQDVIVRGNATRIDALFLREYLHHRHALPETPDVTTFEGGYTDIFFTGVADDVWHCDVASLYPSVILRFDYLPTNDHLGVFAGLLTDLRTFRLEAKRQMQDAATATSRQHFSALQNTFKILINSFYGYLGFAQGHFADFTAAANVTAKGRALLRQMVAWLESQGAHVIEIDTDGIYFQPPADTSVETLDAGLQAELPSGIDVDFDHRYAAMFSYKAKNYALLDADGNLHLKGAALKSRGMEPYLRDFLLQLIRLILTRNTPAAHQLRDQFAHAITQREWPIDRLAKTEALQDSLAAYEKKISASSRNRSAAFELALRSGHPYQAGDPITYYITGDKKKVTAYEAAKMTADWNPLARDENPAYYLAKLDDLFKKFTPFLPPPENPQASLSFT